MTVTPKWMSRPSSRWLTNLIGVFVAPVTWANEARNYQMAAVYAVLMLALSSLTTIIYLTALRTPREVYQR